jgi:hypothetical protein
LEEAGSPMGREVNIPMGSSWPMGKDRKYPWEDFTHGRSWVDFVSPWVVFTWETLLLLTPAFKSPQVYFKVAVSCERCTLRTIWLHQVAANSKVGWAQCCPAVLKSWVGIYLSSAKFCRCLPIRGVSHVKLFPMGLLDPWGALSHLW